MKELRSENCRNQSRNLSLFENRIPRIIQKKILSICAGGEAEVYQWVTESSM